MGKNFLLIMALNFDFKMKHEYPASINSCREFIMNTNGDVFTGYVQAYGKIPEENIFGNVREIGGSREEFFERIIGAEAFDFFVGQVKAHRIGNSMDGSKNSSSEKLKK